MSVLWSWWYVGLVVGVKLSMAGSSTICVGRTVSSKRNASPTQYTAVSVILSASALSKLEGRHNWRFNTYLETGGVHRVYKRTSGVPHDSAVLFRHNKSLVITKLRQAYLRFEKLSHPPTLRCNKSNIANDSSPCPTFHLHRLQDGERNLLRCPQLHLHLAINHL